MAYTDEKVWMAKKKKKSPKSKVIGQMTNSEKNICVISDKD